RPLTACDQGRLLVDEAVVNPPNLVVIRIGLLKKWSPEPCRQRRDGFGQRDVGSAHTISSPRPDDFRRPVPGLRRRSSAASSGGQQDGPAPPVRNVAQRLLLQVSLEFLGCHVISSCRGRSRSRNLSRP